MSRAIEQLALIALDLDPWICIRGSAFLERDTAHLDQSTLGSGCFEA